MTTVCQKCGDTGFEDCLVYCKSCKIFAEHRYCLDKIPKFTESDVHWLCEKCNVRASTPRIDTFNNTSIRSGTKKYAVSNHQSQRSHANYIRRMKNCHQEGPSIARTLGPSTARTLDKSLNDASHCLEKDVSHVTSASKELKSSHIGKGDLLSTREKNGVRPMGISEHLGNEITKSRNVNQRRKLIVDDDDVEVAMKHSLRQHSHSDLQRRNGRHWRSASIAKRSINVDKPVRDIPHCLGNDAFSVASLLKGSKSSNIKQVDSQRTNEKNGRHPVGKKSENLGSQAGEGRNMKERRKLITDDDYDEDVPCSLPNDVFAKSIPCRSSAQVNKPAAPSSSPENCGSIPVQSDRSLLESAADCISQLSVCPIARPVWRGYFQVCGKKYGPILAHLSNRACKKACDVAELLPQLLLFERVPRLEAWPKCFKETPPTDDNIGLYFFPGETRVKAALGQLLDDAIEKDQVLKVIVGTAELLVFSSTLLPQQFHLYDGGYYLWGLFKARCPSIPPAHDHLYSRLNEVAGPLEENQHCNVFNGVPAYHYPSLNGGAEGNADGNVSCGSQASSCRVENNSNDAPSCRVVGNSNDIVKTENCDPFLGGVASVCLPINNSSSSTKLAGETVASEFNGNVESNFSLEHGAALDASTVQCLELFPLGIEDLGLDKVRGSDVVDLELGLEPIKERKFECKPIMEEPVVLLLGREIFP